MGGADVRPGEQRPQPPRVTPRTEPTAAWDVEVSRPSAVVTDGTVFLREPESLRALDAGDGDEWFEVSRPPGSRLRYVDGRLYDLSPNRYDPDAADSRLSRLHAVTLDGTSAWDDPVRHNDPIGSFVEREGYVYVSTGTDTIHHHDADTGERVDATVHDGGVRVLANRDGVLYATLADGLVAYDVDDGGLAEQWRHGVDEARGFEPAAVAVGDGWVALVRHHRIENESAVSVFDSADGAFGGSVTFDRPITDWAIGEGRYVTTRRRGDDDSTAGEVRAFDGTDERWSVELENTPLRLALAGGTLYVGTAVEAVKTITLDAENGDELWRMEGVFPEAVVGETVYATTDDDRFVALRS